MNVPDAKALGVGTERGSDGALRVVVATVRPGDAGTSFDYLMTADQAEAMARQLLASADEVRAFEVLQ